MRTKREQVVFFSNLKGSIKKEILLWKLRFLKTFYEIESRLKTMLSIKLLNSYSFGLSRVK